MTRHIPFDGIENFRDFGGYAGAGGRRLPSGRLFRSAHHHRASDADLARLRDLGVRLIVDLRGSEERRKEPSRRWAGFEAAVIENDLAADLPAWAPPPEGPSAEWVFQRSLAAYRKLPFEPRHIDLYSRYFQALALTQGPVIVHCTAGKDRTGLICAFTHHLAGVHPDDIRADYLLTNDPVRIANRMAQLGHWYTSMVGQVVPDEVLRAAASVHEAYLDSAFEAIDERYGSLDRYLEQALGVDAAHRARLEERLLA